MAANERGRIELLRRTLRDAGLDLATIRSVLAGATTLGEARRGRLLRVEAEIAGLRQVAAALRASLRSAPDEEDLRRLCAVARLSTDRRRRTMEGFYQGVKAMLDEATPELPDEPTRERVDAWIELCELAGLGSLASSALRHTTRWGGCGSGGFALADGAGAAPPRPAPPQGAPVRSPIRGSQIFFRGSSSAMSRTRPGLRLRCERAPDAGRER
ncbi:hypothetical protein WME94_05890 [Sorangium sp. So ce429]